MQRIISMQVVNRNNDRTSSEFVTKRLCCSFVFSVAFLSLLGGFLLGRYATDRALFIRNAAIRNRQESEEKNSMDTIKNITTLLSSIHNMTVLIASRHDYSFNYQEFLVVLNCGNVANNAAASLNEENLQMDLVLTTEKILNDYLGKADLCFLKVHGYLDDYLRKNLITD